MRKILFSVGLVSMFFCNLILAQDSLKDDKEQIKLLVHCAAAGLGGILKNIHKDKVIPLLRDYVDAVHFYPDNSGYFYVHDYNCVVIAHGGWKKLQDKSLFDYKDIKGKFAIQELTNVAKNGGGFVEYYWRPKAGSKEVKKIGYAELIPGTNFVIGTSIYSKSEK